MLSSLISPHITGTYAFSLIPISLPTELVEALLPASWRHGNAFLSDLELQEQGLSVPSPGEGKRWVCVQAGEQRNTGPPLPGGKSTFYEAKVEIPFLRHPSSSTNTPYTFKQTLLFSSLMMAISSSAMIGLRSHKTSFAVSDTQYEAQGWMRVVEESGNSAEVSQEWTEQLVRQVIGGWWAGEKTGATVTKFLMDPALPPSTVDVLVSLHLPSFTQLSVDRVQALLPSATVEDGWLTVPAKGWKLEERTRMETAKVGSV